MDSHRKQELHIRSIPSKFLGTVAGCLLRVLDTDKSMHHNHSTAQDAVDCRVMEGGL
jgi:hypothetical protein